MEVAFGTLALVGQVVDTSFKIRKAIETFRSASEEISNLALKLDVVAQTCDWLKKAIENEQICVQNSTPLAERGVLVLEDINKTLLKLESLLPKQDGKGEKKKRQGIHFLKKKDDIKTFNERLDQKLNMLNLMLMTTVFANQTQRVEQPTQEDRQPQEPISRAESCISDIPATIKRSEPTKTTRVLLERVAYEASWFLGLRSVLEKRKVTKKSKWKNGEETTTVSKTNSLAIKHCSSPYAIQIMWWLAGPLSITCSLSIPHMIDSRAHKDIRWKFNRLCYGGSIKGIQKMFSDRILTPTTLIDGATLFEWAASFPQPDLCRFLLQQNSKLTADEYLMGSKDHPGRNSIDSRFTTNEVSESYSDIIGLCLATEVPTVLQYRFLVSTMCNPRDMLMCFQKFCPYVFAEEWIDFIDAAWDEAVLLLLKDIDSDSHWTPAGGMYEDWFPLFGRIIEGGVDPSRHIKGIKGSRTALWELLTMASCPFNLGSALTYWRYILWACGVDIEQYLSDEWARSDIMWDRNWEEQRTFGWPRKLTQKTVNGHVFPSWTRLVDSRSEAFEVRREFKNLGPHKPFYVGPSIPFMKSLADVDDVKRHQAWKTFDCANPQLVKQEAWPFGYLPTRDPWTHHRSWYQSLSNREEAARVEKSFNYAKELLQMRFERRQRKKLYKSGYLRRYKSLRKLPGAWNEDFA